MVRRGQPGGGVPGGGAGGVPRLPEADEAGRHRGRRLPAVRRQRQQLHGLSLHFKDVAGEQLIQISEGLYHFSTQYTWEGIHSDSLVRLIYDVPPSLPTCSASYANLPSAHAEPGRGWNSLNQNKPDPTIRVDASPCA